MMKQCITKKAQKERERDRIKMWKEVRAADGPCSQDKWPTSSSVLTNLTVPEEAGDSTARCRDANDSNTQR